MGTDPISTSLFDHLTETGFNSTLISTYNCYFPFFEEVVLRRLVATGCNHNILMMDATRCAEAFDKADTRPNRAGRDYTLIPVKIGGAFHPKIILRLGKAKGALLVGSHNATLSGFGLNDEVTNIFRAEGADLRTAGGPLRQAFDFLAGFLPTDLSEVVDAFDGLKIGAPWIDLPLGTGDPNRTLLTATNSGPDLWSQIIRLIPSEADTAFICAPFFDPKLAFIRRIQNEVRPKKLVIGIDPTTTQIAPVEAASLSGVNWVNIAGMAPIPKRRENSSSKLHAKLFWFTGHGEQLLISGSANPSVAAYFAHPGSRNAEAVVADRRIGAGDEIGIGNLLDATPITTADWIGVAARLSSLPKTDGVQAGRITVAVPTTTGFLSHGELPLDLTLRGIDENGLSIGDAVVRAPLVIDAPEAVVHRSQYLEGFAEDVHQVVLVHRSEEIAKNIGGDTRRALRQAIGTLEEDPGQLETLLKLAEKVIFDSDDIVRAAPMRTIYKTAEPDKSNPAPSSLALDASGRTPVRRRQRIAQGDIIVLLDALVHRLGEGFHANPENRTRNDGDEIGADEENGGELARKTPDYKMLAKSCQGKSRTLIRRMKAQLDVAATTGLARRGIVQLAAVLAVIRSLRLIEQRDEWRKKGLTLLDPSCAVQLLQAGVATVAWGNSALAAKAVIENEGEKFEELSTAVGLLAWLAWDSGVDVEKVSEGFDIGTRENAENPWNKIQLLATLAPYLDGDDTAITFLKDAVSRTPRRGTNPDQWLTTHVALMSACALVAESPETYGQKGREPHPGDLAILSVKDSPRVRVILDVRPGKGGGKVIIFDPDDSNKERAFMASHVASCAWRLIP